MNIIKNEAFIKNYLLNKFSHCGKYEFLLNFSDISFDYRPYIEANYYDYITVKYIDKKEANLSEDALKHLNMLHRDYVNSYIWTKRDELLKKLKIECEELNKSYKLSEVVKQLLIAELTADELYRITSVYREWKVLRCFKSIEKKDSVNYNRFTAMNDIINNNMIKFMLADDDYVDEMMTYSFNVSTKEEKKRQSYLSGRLNNALTFTKNDLEEKKTYYWAKSTKDSRMLRSEFLAQYNWTDLGDMSSNYPNLLNCIKTGVYTDEDFHSKVAAENNISRSVAKMAAVRCCFNCRKSDILFRLFDDADITKLGKEIEMIDNSGCMRFDAEEQKVKINRGYKVNNCHNWFIEHSDNEFFKYCADFLTSWDACSLMYKNDLCKSDLSIFSSAVESCVILDARMKGVIILNAYDHAYCINGKYYDWKGAYKKYAELLAPIFNKAKEKDLKGIIKSKNKGKSVLRVIAEKGNKKAVKAEVREFLAEKMAEYNDIDKVLDLATNIYKWSPPLKCYWKKLIKKGEIVTMTKNELYEKWKIADYNVLFLEKNHYELFKQRYPIPTGVPLVVLDDDGLLTVKCIDILKEAEYRWTILPEIYRKELKNLTKKANRIFDSVIHNRIDVKEADKILHKIYTIMIGLYLGGPYIECNKEDLRYLVPIWQEFNKIVGIFKCPAEWATSININLGNRVINNFYDDFTGRVTLMKMYINDQYTASNYLIDKGILKYNNGEAEYDDEKFNLIMGI